MKSKIFILFTYVVILTTAFSSTVLAYQNHLDYENTFDLNNSTDVILITEDEFKQYLVEHQYDVTPYNWCCGTAQLEYRYKKTAHLYPNGGGFCIGLLAIGDEYCVNCYTIWNKDIVIDQTNYGCGVYHQ